MIMTAVDTANPVLLPSVGARNHEGPYRPAPGLGAPTTYRESAYN
jgi:hypothetical protein